MVTATAPATWSTSMVVWAVTQQWWLVGQSMAVAPDTPAGRAPACRHPDTGEVDTRAVAPRGGGADGQCTAGPAWQATAVMSRMPGRHRRRAHEVPPSTVRDGNRLAIGRLAGLADGGAVASSLQATRDR